MHSIHCTIQTMLSYHKLYNLLDNRFLANWAVPACLPWWTARADFCFAERWSGKEVRSWQRRWWLRSRVIHSIQSHPIGVKNFSVMRRLPKGSMACPSILLCFITPGSGARTRTPMDFFVSFSQKDMTWQTSQPSLFSWWKMP